MYYRLTTSAGVPADEADDGWLGDDGTDAGEGTQDFLRYGDALREAGKLLELGAGWVRIETMEA